MLLTDTQKRLVYILLTALSGPAVAIIARYTHMGGDDVQLWTNLLAALTSSVGLVWGISSFGAAPIAKDASHIEGVQVHAGPTAPQAVKDLATDKANPDVVPMNGPPVQK